MKFTRRDALALGLGATAVAMLPMRALAAADEAVAAFTGGAETGEGGITLTAPEIAENGNTVPVSVDAPVPYRFCCWLPATRPRVSLSSPSVKPPARSRHRPVFVWLARKTLLLLPKWQMAAS